MIELYRGQIAALGNLVFNLKLCNLLVANSRG